MSITTRPSGARFQTFPSGQSPRSILRSIAFTEYPVIALASGSSTYRAVATTTVPSWVIARAPCHAPKMDDVTQAANSALFGSARAGGAGISGWARLGKLHPDD